MIDWKIIVLALVSQWIATRVVNVIVQPPVFEEVYTLGWRKK